MIVAEVAAAHVPIGLSGVSFSQMFSLRLFISWVAVIDLSLLCRDDCLAGYLHEGQRYPGRLVEHLAWSKGQAPPVRVVSRRIALAAGSSERYTSVKLLVYCLLWSFSSVDQPRSSSTCPLIFRSSV